MRTKIGIVLFIAAAGMAAAGCERSAPETPAEDIAATDSTGADASAMSTGGVATGEVCGGIAGIQCSTETDYCASPVGQCGTADVAGVCTARPEFCTEQYDPVCGCDGETYGNACQAATAGVNVQSAGECSAAGT